MNYRVWVCVVLSVGVAACCTLPAAPPSEPVLCPASPPAQMLKLVYVDVVLGPGGPVITPETCVVRSGTRVLWRTAENALEPFELAFAESPVDPARQRVAGSDGQKDFLSQRMGRRQEVLITAKEVSAESDIKYDVRIGPHHLDPGIKIMPR